MLFIIDLLEVDLNKPTSYVKIFLVSVVISFFVNAVGKFIG